MAKKFWVVERYIANRLHYWTALSREWTEDIGMATRLADQESADMVLHTHCHRIGRVAEHKMVGGGNER